MKQSVVDFCVHLPGLAWWREIPDMPFEVWEVLREYVEKKTRG